MRFQEDAWDGIVGNLYESVLSPAKLGVAIRGFEELIGSDGCHLYSVNSLGEEQLTVFTMDWLDQAALLRYYQHYIHEDPRKAAVDSRELGRAYQCSDFFSPGFVDRNGFYQDFLLPLGARHIAGGTIAKGASHNAYVVFNRTKGRPDFGVEEMAHIQRFLPHIARVVHMMVDRRLRALQSVADAQMLDAQGFGVIALNAKGRVAYTNGSGKQQIELLGSELFKAGRVREDGALYSAVCAAVQTRQPQMLRCLTGEGEFVLTVCPSPKEAKELWLPCVQAELTAIHALVLVRHLQPGRDLNSTSLMQLFGLSPMEARLAKGLAEGQSVEEYADAFHVSVATARTQLRAVLTKTGYRRQLDLVRKLASMPVA